VLITSGGVSMGAYDVVKEALSELGGVEFTRVAMQPGKPQGFGHLGDAVPIFCLPGNPVSSIVSFEAFVRPAIRKLLGKRQLERSTVQAVALEGAKSPRGIRQYLWAENNKTLLYLQDADGDENWHVFGVDLDSGSVRDYTAFQGIQARVTATDPGSVRDFHAFARQTGNELLEHGENDGAFWFVLKRR